MSPEREPRNDLAELLTQRAWVRRFAAALAGAEGEDLAQETWLRVLTRPIPSLAHPRAWLAGVARNAARMRARGEDRRAQREQAVARPDFEPSTDELAAQAELEQLAVRAVLELDEPYRETLLLRFVRGLEPAEIAHRVGVPASTVRNRIARGLELVRARLDARQGGERGAWAAVLLPGIRFGVTGGGIVTAKALAAGVAVAAVAGILWLARSGHERGHAAAPSLAEVSPSALSTPAQEVDSTRTPEAVAARELRESLSVSGSTASAVAATALDVVVIWARDGTPARDEAVEVTSADAEPFPLTRARRTDGDGRVRFEELAPGEQWISGFRGGSEGLRLARGETRTVALTIPLGVDVDCSVVDGEGQPVPRAEIWAAGNRSSGRTQGAVLGTADARGRLLLRDVGSYALAACAPGFTPSVQRRVRGNPGERIAITLTLGGPGAALEGFVRDRNGTPIVGAELQIGTPYPEEVTLPDGTHANGPPEVRLIADSSGRFAVEGLPAGKLEVKVRALGFAPLETELDFTAGETEHAELVLETEARVTGTVRDAAGQPVAGASITGAANYFDFAGSETHSGADGTFTLRGLSRGTCQIGAQHDLHGRAQTTLVIPADADATWDPVLLSGGRVAGRVLDERDQPLEHWHVAAVERDDPGPWLREDRTDADGAFALESCPATPFVLEVRSPAEFRGDPVVLFDAFQPGDEGIVIHVLDADVPSATITGRIVSADGAPLVEPRYSYTSERSGFGFERFPDELGRFQIGPLRPGGYTLSVTAEGMGSVTPEPIELAAKEALDLGTFALEPAGRLHVRLRTPSGEEVSESVWSQVLANQRQVAYVRYAEGQGYEALARGSYVLRTRAPHWRVPDTPIAIEPGKVTEIELALEPATWRQLAFTLPASDTADRLRVIVRDEEGLTLEESDGGKRLEGAEAFAFRLGIGGLVVGSYSVEARTDTGRVAVGTLSVTSLERSTEPLVLPLR